MGFLKKLKSIWENATIGQVALVIVVIAVGSFLAIHFLPEPIGLYIAVPLFAIVILWGAINTVIGLFRKQ